MEYHGSHTCPGSGHVFGCMTSQYGVQHPLAPAQLGASSLGEHICPGSAPHASLGVLQNVAEVS